MWPRSSQGSGMGVAYAAYGTRSVVEMDMWGTAVFSLDHALNGRSS